MLCLNEFTRVLWIYGDRVIRLVYIIIMRKSFIYILVVRVKNYCIERQMVRNVVK